MTATEHCQARGRERKATGVSFVSFLWTSSITYITFTIYLSTWQTFAIPHPLWRYITSPSTKQQLLQQPFRHAAAAAAAAASLPRPAGDLGSSSNANNKRRNIKDRFYLSMNVLFRNSSSTPFFSRSFLSSFFYFYIIITSHNSLNHYYCGYHRRCYYIY